MKADGVFEGGGIRGIAFAGAFKQWKNMMLNGSG